MINKKSRSVQKTFKYYSIPHNILHELSNEVDPKAVAHELGNS